MGVVQNRCAPFVSHWALRRPVVVQQVGVLSHGQMSEGLVCPYQVRRRRPLVPCSAMGQGSRPSNV